MIIRQVPPLSISKKEVLKGLERELDTKPYVYPITDTLVAVYTSPPSTEDLFIPYAVKKLIERGEEFLFFGTYGDRLFWFCNSDKGIQVGGGKDFSLIRTSALTSCRGVKDVFVLSGDERAKKVLEEVGQDFKEIQLEEGNVEKELAEVITSDSLWNAVSKVWEFLKEFFRTRKREVSYLVLLFLLLPAGFFAYREYQSYVKTKEEKEVKRTVKPLPFKHLPKRSPKTDRGEKVDLYRKALLSAEKELCREDFFYAEPVKDGWKVTLSGGETVFVPLSRAKESEDGFTPCVEVKGKERIIAFKDEFGRWRSYEEIPKKPHREDFKGKRDRGKGDRTLRH